MNFNFIASDNFTLDDLNSVERFVDAFPDFQNITLNNENELYLLLNSIGIKELDFTPIKSKNFIKIWDLSNYKFPEYDEVQFEDFYRRWIEISGRENNMDEFGNLVFLKGLTEKWNLYRFRLIVEEI